MNETDSVMKDPFSTTLTVTPEAPPKIEELKQHESEQDAPPEKEQQVETEMLKQEYLLDPTMTVGDLVRQENLEIIDFARFECGESAVGETSQWDYSEWLLKSAKLFCRQIHFHQIKVFSREIFFQERITRKINFSVPLHEGQCIVG